MAKSESKVAIILTLLRKGAKLLVNIKSMLFWNHLYSNPAANIVVLMVQVLIVKGLNGYRRIDGWL